jgi:hypothetical protein
LPRSPRAAVRAGEPFSLSIFITRAIGVIFPLVAIVIFVFSMGNMACSQGNAPVAFCNILTEIAGQ